MEEMYRTHKEPVWGWVAVAADLIAQARQDRAAAKARRSRPVGAVPAR